MCNRFSDFNVKSDKGKTPLIVLRCADNRQLFEGTGERKRYKGMTVKSIQEAWDEVNKIFPYDYEKMKRIRALERLTKKQYITLNTLVIGFITRWLELVSAFDVISSCIRELEYHQSAVQNKSGVNLPDATYL